MAQMFPRVSGTSTGYERAQVDEFFAEARAAYEGGTGMSADDVRRAAFDLVRGGYRPGAVDAALDRLENAFIQRERTAFMETHGQDAWMADVAQRATVLYPRLNRPAGERFAQPRRGRGYDRAGVDAVLDRLVDYFDSGRALSATDLRTVTFASARRPHAYDEGPVDAFLDRAVDILLAVE
ncbi:MULTISPECIES: DivIVA domain-containing protein [unclassified Pseudactinotalea]|uniref:DivIVA domain-containing protein n=1 Tax=unclassified Pseudactinotalea TaxID=2649176 RepID=UPI00128B09B2|nr:MULTISPECIES: DivIVA domain-containing protein [unclassified Pseudactinotalea]MPV49591.1 DivIVA domain-containing protein [Pseudactinotalea sp. HY160]QGH69890.1 DivIVA domain-containing protein [Pseudactinotalea sp. HY158]